MTSPLQQKLKITGPVVITANRLADGAVVYRTRDGGWSTRLDHAAVASTAAAAGELLAAAAADDIRAVGAYVAPVRVEADGTVRPGNLRESIRQHGPTIDLPAVPSAVPLAPLSPPSCPASCRASTFFVHQDVDGRDKPGHDGVRASIEA